MKNYSYYLSILCIVFEVLMAPTSAQDNKFDICKTNNGNIEINSVFRFKADQSNTDSLYIFSKGVNIVLNDFKFNSKDKVFEYNSIEQLDLNSWKINEKFKFAFPLKYDRKNRIIKVYVDQVDNIDILRADVLQVTVEHTIASTVNISIDIYKCITKPEPMNLCTLFASLPQEDLTKNVISITTFPFYLDSGGTVPLSERLFVYYKETPPKPLKSKCRGCYQSKRFVYISGNQVFNNVKLNEIKWMVDTTANDCQCIDLDGVIVNSSVAITDFLGTGDGYYRFDLMEFSGTQYSIYAVSIKDNVIENQSKNFAKLGSGQIGSLFQCPQPPTIAPPPTPKPTPPPTQPTKSRGTKQTKSTNEPPNGKPSAASPTGSTKGAETPTKAKPIEPFRPPPTVRPDEKPETTQLIDTTTSSGSLGVSALIFFIIIIILVIIGVTAWYLMTRGNGEEGAAPPPTLSTSASPPEETAGGSEGITPESTKIVRSD